MQSHGKRIGQQFTKMLLLKCILVHGKQESLSYTAQFPSL